MCINYKMLISYFPENYSNTVPYFENAWPIILLRSKSAVSVSSSGKNRINYFIQYWWCLHIFLLYQNILFTFRYKRVPLEYKPRNLSNTKIKPFASIYLEQGQSSDKSIGCEDCRDVRARQERRNKRVRPWKELNSSETMTSNDEDNENASNTC